MAKGTGKKSAGYKNMDKATAAAYRATEVAGANAKIKSGKGRTGKKMGTFERKAAEAIASRAAGNKPGASIKSDH